MNTAIVYYSKHHGNTKKLLDALAQRWPITLIDVSDTPAPDLSGYDMIGFASGVYYSKFQKQVIACARDCLPAGRPVFMLYTCGMKRAGYTAAVADAAREKGCEVLGEYGCPGFNTFGPLKIIGGMCKGRPNGEDVQGAIRFMEALMERGKTH